MTACVYEIENLVKCYPGQESPANNHITLRISEGEIFGLLGANGAGKTTLIRQMVNLLSSTSGSIKLYGELLDENPMHVPMYVGYMPQESQSLNNLTVEEALFFTAHLRGMSRKEANRERERLLNLWQIEDLHDKYNTKLSSGQRRLLRIAVAMAATPPVLILDEPTNDLDPQRRKLVWEILRRTNREYKTTIIFITHDAIEAEKIIQRVGIMQDGKLVAEGRPSDLKHQVDQKLRLELFFTPESPPTLPDDLSPYEIEPGRWITFVDWQDATKVLSLLNLEQLDDFRFYSATLEDLYLHYANRAT